MSGCSWTFPIDFGDYLSESRYREIVDDVIGKHDFTDVLFVRTAGLKFNVGSFSEFQQNMKLIQESLFPR